jgi:hypothetical protein
MPHMSSMHEGWYWSRDGQQLGPYSWEQLCQFAREGRIHPADLIWHTALGKWATASQIPGLFGTAQSTPDRSPIKTPAKRARLTAPRLFVGGVAFVGLALVIAVALIATRAPAAGVPPAALSSPATSAPVQPAGVQSAAKFSVDARGGRFENGELTLSVPPAPDRAQIDLVVSRTESALSPPEDVTYQSALYRLEGPLHLLSGNIQVEFAIPDEVLSAGSVDGEEFAIVAEEEVVAPSAGPSIRQLPLPSQVDRDRRVVRAVLALPKADSATAGGHLLASLTWPRPTVQDEISTTTIGLRLERGWVNDSLASDRFRVTFSRKRVAPEAVAQLLQLLEDQKRKIESLGLTFEARTAWPIEVELEDWGTQGATQRYGLFVPSRWGANGCQLQFNAAYFRNINLFNDNRREVQATAGHELFHLVQFLYEPATSFSKATGVFGQPFHWLEEATSTWFEPLAVDDPGYVPAIAKDNIAFVHTPLYFPEPARAQDHGYGASLFLRYLTQKYGSQLIGDLWQRVRNDNASGTGAEALNKALDAVSDSNSSVGLEWLTFVEMYLAQPAQLAPDLDVSALTSKAAVLKAEVVNGQDDVKISFLQNLADYQAAVTDGWLKADVPATLKLQFSLRSLTAHAFRITFRNDDATRQALSTPGQLHIAVASPEWSGVLVYGVPRGQSVDAVVPLAGAPWNFMSSGDPAAGQGTQLVVDGLSQRDGTGSYEALLLIPFNYAGYSYTNRDAGLATINVELVYQATPPLLEPTPTVEPPQPADNPCDGLTPEDILKPSLNPRLMQCRLRCVPIGGPTPSRDQLLACMYGEVGGHGGP